MNANALQHGIFSECAPHYRNRVAYSSRVIHCLAAHVRAERDGFCVAELAAGTGVLTQTLASEGLSGYAVEPNEEMRAQAIQLGNGRGRFSWLAGSAEETRLPTASVDWVLVSNAFHLLNMEVALREVQRILRPSGYLTAIWMLDKPCNGNFQQRVESLIRERAPGLQALHPPVDDLMERLGQSAGFGESLYVEAEEVVPMPPSRYLGIWHSSHLIPNAVDRSHWQQILAEIESEALHNESILTQWRTRAWTVRKC